MHQACNRRQQLAGERGSVLDQSSSTTSAENASNNFCDHVSTDSELVWAEGACCVIDGLSDNDHVLYLPGLPTSKGNDFNLACK